MLLAVIGYGGYHYYLLNNDFSAATETIKDLKIRLDSAKQENVALSGNLQSEQQKNLAIQGQVDQISGTVTTLTKLSQTDKELLQKYSKIYFLNENYVPRQLSLIPPQYAKDPSKILQIHINVWPHLESMMKAAANDGSALLIVSAYRSFGEQSALKSSYRVTYGVGANSFSADQGYSEHQLGTTLDFVTPSSTMATFEKTSANKWLLANAYKYGFILSYPKQNKYYVYEPWHWRFVGVPLATKLHEGNKYFYDLSQREIDQYLVSIFD